MGLAAGQHGCAVGPHPCTSAMLMPGSICSTSVQVAPGANLQHPQQLLWPRRRFHDRKETGWRLHEPRKIYIEGFPTLFISMGFPLC